MVQEDSISSLPALSLYVVAFVRLLPIVARFGTNISMLRFFSPSVKLLNQEIKKLEKYSIQNEISQKLEQDLVKFDKNFELKIYPSDTKTVIKIFLRTLILK